MAQMQSPSSPIVYLLDPVTGVTFAMRDRTKRFLHLALIIFRRGTDSVYKMCSFVIGGVASFYSLKSSSKIAFYSHQPITVS